MAGAKIPFLTLIHGDDDHAVKRRAQDLFNSWVAELGGIDHEVIDGDVGRSDDALKSLEKLRMALQSLPFFGGNKIVWLKNCTYLGEEKAATSAAVTENLKEFSKELQVFPWKHARLMISAGKVNKTRTFYKTLDTFGNVEYFAGLSGEDKYWAQKAEDMVAETVKACGKSIADEAAALMATSIGPNARQLKNEAEKMTLYVGDRPSIQVEDVELMVPKNKQAQAFALGDALGDRDLPRAMKTLSEELWSMQFDNQKSEIGILYGLITKIRTLLMLKEMLQQGLLKTEVDYRRFAAQFEKLPDDQFPADKRFNPKSMSTYIFFKAIPQVRKYSSIELVRALDLLLTANMQLVSSSTDSAMILQQTLMQIILTDQTKS